MDNKSEDKGKTVGNKRKKIGKERNGQQKVNTEEGWGKGKQKNEGN